MPAFVMQVLTPILLFSSLISCDLAVRGSSNNTANSSSLLTWWHDTGEINTQTPVQDGNVRQSHLYAIQVSTSDSSEYFDSFVYESIPRNGNGNILDPNDPNSFTDQDDGITVESDIGMTMAWTQFLYSQDATVKVQRLDGKSVSASDVTIRPTNLGYQMTESDGEILITVPFSSDGARFSVEFSDQSYSFHNADDGTTSHFVQDTKPGGTYYVENFTDSNPIIAAEPLNSLLIFASPFPDPTLVPDAVCPSSLVVPQGKVDPSTLLSTSKSTVVFEPGVYWFTGTANANLSSSVNWVYFAPGAYVKGSVQYGATQAAQILATGHGVLSGEQYVYQANPDEGWNNSKSDGSSVKMWRGVSSSGINQTFVLKGPTVNAPPFNSMDFYGDLESLSCDVDDYKQVGAFFGQTDGLEMYPGSRVRNVFYHSNDDTLKTYWSNVDVRQITVWKGTTAPIIQFGWASRDLRNVSVAGVDVVHARWNTNGSHGCIVGANQVYTDAEDDTNTADLADTVADVSYSAIRLEGVGGSLFRIFPLQTIDGLTIADVTVDSAPLVASSAIGLSELVYNEDPAGSPAGVEAFVVRNYVVNGSKVTGYGGPGGINAAPQYHITIE